MYYKQINTEIGLLTIVAHNENITHLFLAQSDFDIFKEENKIVSCSQCLILEKAAVQLQQYFQGERSIFDLPFSQAGTAFQEKVWRALAEIPYGESRTYLDIAIKIDNPKAVRAVGQANKANQLPVFIPCHRVIGKNEKLTGYAGKQINIKAKLLDIEQIPYKNSE
ncbi:methylated-DNA--[protein]-cysteine S-methyltransferase [Metabacillus fastidiosus]|uniref:methylated-DNA--[protein]-cysteine S-methyltransferase n=1 Tax=Metabacillus fastidiosus TaxID=1458 RepID=UPI003D2AFE39